MNCFVSIAALAVTPDQSVKTEWVNTDADDPPAVGLTMTTNLGEILDVNGTYKYVAPVIRGVLRRFTIP